MITDINSYDSLKSIFTESFLATKNETWLESVMRHANDIIHDSYAYKDISSLLDFRLDETEDSDFERLNQKMMLKNKNMINVMKVVLKIHDIMRRLCRLLSFESDFVKFVLDKTNLEKKRSNDDGDCQEFYMSERVMCLLYFLFDIISNHKGEDLNKFILYFDKLCGKSSIFALMHKLYHKMPTNVLKAVVIDAYVIVKMMINIVFDENISDEYISLNMFEEKCTDLNCDMCKWVHQYVWASIIQNGIYVKKLSEDNFESVVHDEFINTHGGNLLNVLAHMYTNKSKFNILYCVGMIYSFLVDVKAIPLETINTDGPEMITVDNRVFNFENGVITVAYEDQKTGVIVCQVIERQTDAYVYHDVYSTKDMNVSKILYFDDMNRDTPEEVLDVLKDLRGAKYETPKVERKKFVPVMEGGAVLKGGLTKFNGIQMTEFSEIISYAICFGVVILIVCMIVKEYRRRNATKINHVTDDTTNARLLGAINPQVPLNLI